MRPRKLNGRTPEEIERMCLLKHRWSDELEARAGAFQALERRPEVKRLFVYRCPSCKGFHLTKRRGPDCVGTAIKATGANPEMKKTHVGGTGIPVGLLDKRWES